MAKKNNTMLWIIVAIIAVIAIYFLGPQVGLFALITPGVVEDGYILLSDTNLPMYETVISGKYYSEYYTFPQSCSEVTRWNVYLRDCNYIPQDCCGSATVVYTPPPTWGYYSEVVCEATVSTICEEDRTKTTTKTFNVPSDFREVWFLVDTPDEIDIIPGSADCTLNGQSLNLNFGGASGWMEVTHPREITDKVIIGENTIVCSKTTESTSDYMNIDIIVYENIAPCMEYMIDNCRNTPSDIIPSAASNCGEYGGEYPKKCIYNNWEADIGTNNVYGGGSLRPTTIDLTGSETQLVLQSQSTFFSSGSGSVKTIFDLKSTSFKVDLESSISRGSYSIEVTGTTVYSSSDSKDVGLLEVSPRFLNPNMIDVYFKGQKLTTIDISGIEPYVKFSVSSQGDTNNVASATLTLTNPRYQLPFSCHMEANDLLAMESFTGGQEIGLYSTRYAVKSFCLDHPVIVTSGIGSTTTAEPYALWIRGNTTYISADQIWTVFYIMTNPGTIPVTCPDEFFDVDTGKCTTAGGIVQICSEGQFDPLLGLCVVQPESVCAEGRFNVETGLCEYNPPVQYICP